MAHYEKAGGEGLGRPITAKVRTGYVPISKLSIPPEELELEQAFVLLRCRNAVGEPEIVFQTDREFVWQELAPFWEDVGAILRRGPVRDYL